MQDDKLTGDLTLFSGDQRTSIPDVPRNVLQALYVAVTNLKETLTQQYRLPAVLDIDDFEQLIAQLEQWSNPYDPITRRVKISASLLSPDDTQMGVKRSEYNSLEEFKSELPGRTDVLQLLTLTFEFLARSEETGIVNQCELVLELKGVTRRIFYNISKADALGGFSARNQNNWTAKSTVRYSDVIVARGLQGVVEDWYRNLPKREFPEIGRIRKLFHESEHYEIFDLIAMLYKTTPLVFGAAFAVYFEDYARASVGQIPEFPF